MRSNIVKDMRQAIEASGLQSGMTVSFHHHLRNGDYVLDMVMREIARLGIRNLRVAVSSVFPAHSCLVELMQQGVVTRLDTNYMSGDVAEAVCQGVLDEPVMFRTHGGRPRAIEAGELHIDVAFIAAPSVDAMGNISGVHGDSACGSLGYCKPDARYAERVVAVTDSLTDAVFEHVAVDHSHIDYIVQVDSIGDAAGIVSGTTRVTRDPVGLVIAEYAAKCIEAAGLLYDGFNFQTGAGGASLAGAMFVRERMRALGIQGGYLLGGVTGFFVDMLEEGLFQNIYDVQCFDLPAVASMLRNPAHHEVSASQYASPARKDALVNGLDAVLLGATEIDFNFNVNVHTDSNGNIMGGSGGHSDAAAGAGMTIVVAPLLRARLPIVVDSVGVISTPGTTVDVFVTEYGVAVNPARTDLKEQFAAFGIPQFDIHDLHSKALSIAGVPVRRPKGTREVAIVEYRDGTVLDTIAV
ncbi:MAG: citrate lyase subunit alpha [Desulfovibrionales bacterium]|nr:citrate lyase subunit alpha [Desulfovibrionales bacterium]